MIAYKRRQLEAKQAAKDLQDLRIRIATAWIQGAAGDPTTRNWTAKASTYAATGYAVADTLIKGVKP